MSINSMLERGETGFPDAKNKIRSAMAEIRTANVKIRTASEEIRSTTLKIRFQQKIHNRRKRSGPNSLGAPFFYCFKFSIVTGSMASAGLKPKIRL